jgi:hypothetical protein
MQNIRLTLASMPSASHVGINGAHTSLVRGILERAAASRTINVIIKQQQQQHFYILTFETYLLFGAESYLLLIKQLLFGAESRLLL